MTIYISFQSIGNDMPKKNFKCIKFQIPCPSQDPIFVPPRHFEHNHKSVMIRKL